jgi:hypothetical protein
MKPMLAIVLALEERPKVYVDASTSEQAARLEDWLHASATGRGSSSSHSNYKTNARPRERQNESKP